MTISLCGVPDGRGVGGGLERGGVGRKDLLDQTGGTGWSYGLPGVCNYLCSSR